MGKIVLPSSHPFAGIVEKLNRSSESIGNLGTEIDAFFDSSEYPVFSHNNTELLAKQLDYHIKRGIPLRFSLLAGEIVHHLRSCLDHIVWHFSDPVFRQDERNRRYVEFPILKEPPRPSDVFTRYERKIKGISSPSVRQLILNFQPYHRPKPVESLLLAIHDMDITDKHRELVLCVSSGAIKLPMDTWQKYVQYQFGSSGEECPDLEADFQRDGKLVPQAALSNFCGMEQEIVVQAMIGMHNYVVRLVGAFDKFL